MRTIDAFALGISPTCPALRFLRGRPFAPTIV
jgi:hypothetical protein